MAITVETRQYRVLTMVSANAIYRQQSHCLMFADHLPESVHPRLKTCGRKLLPFVAKEMSPALPPVAY